MGRCLSFIFSFDVVILWSRFWYHGFAQQGIASFCFTARGLSSFQCSTICDISVGGLKLKYPAVGNYNSLHLRF